MKVIKPVVIEPLTHFASTTLVQDYSNWSSGTTYALGDRVSYGYRIFESLQAGNLANNPGSLSPFQATPDPTAWWVFVGTDNRAAMFDERINTPSSAVDTFTHRWFYYKNVMSIAVLDVNAVTVQLRVLENWPSAPVVIYDETKGLSGAAIYDWYGYFFSEVTTDISQIIFENIPPDVGSGSGYSVYELTVTGVTGDTVSVGEVVGGEAYELGGTQYGVSSGITDYSVKAIDDYGNVSITKRAYSKRMNAKVQVEKEKINGVQLLMYSIRSTPCVWIGSDDPELQEPLVVFGYTKDFSTEISYPTFALMNLDVEGLV